MGAPGRFVFEVETEIEDFVITTLMHKIERLVKKYGIEDDEIEALLCRVDETLALDEAWVEYVS